MSLERNTNPRLTDERNPLDTSSSVNLLSTSIISRGFGEIFTPGASYDINALESPLYLDNSSPQLSELFASRASDYKIHNSSDLPNDSQKHCQQSSMVEKSAVNTYKILLDSVPENSFKTISDMSFDENYISGRVKKEVRASTIYTNLSSDSSRFQTDPISPHVLEESKKGNFSDISRSKIKQPLANRPVASIRNSTFALTNRIFCMKCNAETFTNVSFQMKDMNLWGSIGFFFTAIKCCGEPRALSRYQDIVHSCKKCGSVVARISTI